MHFSQSLSGENKETGRLLDYHEEQLEPKNAIFLPHSGTSAAPGNLSYLLSGGEEREIVRRAQEK